MRTLSVLPGKVCEPYELNRVFIPPWELHRARSHFGGVILIPGLFLLCSRMVQPLRNILPPPLALSGHKGQHFSGGRFPIPKRKIRWAKLAFLLPNRILWDSSTSDRRSNCPFPLSFFIFYHNVQKCGVFFFFRLFFFFNWKWRWQLVNLLAWLQ